MAIKSLNVIVNNNCNSRCQFCNIWKNKEMDFISLANFRNFLDKQENTSLNEISVTGGEPTLHPDFIDILECIVDHHNIENVFLTTNGSSVKKIKQAIEVFFNSNKTLHVVISIDAMPKKNDELRGFRSFDKARNAASAVRELNPNSSIIISSTLNDLTTIDDFKFLVNFVTENGFGFTFRIAEKSKYYGNTNIPDDRFKISSQLKEVVIDYLSKNTHDLYFKVLLDYIKNGNNILLNGNSVNCVAGEKFATVTSKGVILPCIHADSQLGTISDKLINYKSIPVKNCPCFTECVVWPNINYGNLKDLIP